MKRFYCVAILATVSVSGSAYAYEGDHVLKIKAKVEPMLTLKQVGDAPLSGDFKMEHQPDTGMQTKTIPIKITNNQTNETKVKFNLKVNQDATLVAVAGGAQTPSIQLEMKLGNTVLTSAGEDFDLEKDAAKSIDLHIIPSHQPDLPADDYEGDLVVTLAPATI